MARWELDGRNGTVMLVGSIDDGKPGGLAAEIHASSPSPFDTVSAGVISDGTTLWSMMVRSDKGRLKKGHGGGHRRIDGWACNAICVVDEMGGFHRALGRTATMGELFPAKIADMAVGDRSLERILRSL